MTPKHWIILGLVIALLLVGWLWWRRPAAQVPASFARLAAAFQAKRPAGVLAEIHRDYDFRARWPSVFEEFGAVEPRLVAMRALAGLFQMSGEDQLALAWDLQELTVQDDGRVAVRATLQLSSSRGELAARHGPIRRHRFVLARSGWLGRFAIVDHDPIALER